MNGLKKTIFILLSLFSLQLLSAEAIFKDMKGREIPFSSLKGKWVILNYWASWCQPCIDEISELNAFYKSHKKQVALFAVNFESLPRREQLALIQRFGIRYPSLAKNPGRQLGLGPVQGVPATFVFDPEGKLHKTLYGAQTLRSLKRAIRG